MARFIDSSTHAAIIRVRADAPIPGDGQSWATAYPFLADGIVAAQSGDEIWVAYGEYFPAQNNELPNGNSQTIAFILKQGVGIYGGFNGSETSLSQRVLHAPQKDVTVMESVLCGDYDDNDTLINGVPEANTYGENAHFLVIDPFEFPIDNSAILDGFTLRGASRQGAIIVGSCPSGSTPTIRNCYFTRNIGRKGGAAIDIGEPVSPDTHPTITRCTFYNNISTVEGLNYSAGAVSVHDGAGATITNCKFFNNHHDPFDQNGQEGSGAIRVRGAGSLLFISNCVFAGNTTSETGTIAIIGTQGSRITNCTLVNNLGGNGGGGIFSGGPGQTGAHNIVTNCLSWGNNSATGLPLPGYDIEGNYLDVTYCCTKDAAWTPVGNPHNAGETGIYLSRPPTAGHWNSAIPSARTGCPLLQTTTTASLLAQLAPTLATVSPCRPMKSISTVIVISASACRAILMNADASLRI